MYTTSFKVIVMMHRILMGYQFFFITCCLCHQVLWLNEQIMTPINGTIHVRKVSLICKAVIALRPVFSPVRMFSDRLAYIMQSKRLFTQIEKSRLIFAGDANST